MRFTALTERRSPGLKNRREKEAAGQRDRPILTTAIRFTRGTAQFK
jgi:hypothetical protein